MAAGSTTGRNTPLRLAGHNEHRCVIREQLGLYHVVAGTALYRNVAHQSLTRMRDTLVTALKHCVSVHPVLSAVIVDAGSEKPAFARPPTVDLGRHIDVGAVAPSVDYGTSLNSVLTTAHNSKIHNEFDQPPWKLFVLPLEDGSFLAAFAYSHAIGDGMSGLAFHKTFLYGLDQPLDAPSSSDVISTDGLPMLPPSMEGAGHLAISWSFLLAPLLGAYLPKYIGNMLGLRAAVGPERPATLWSGRDRSKASDLEDDRLRTAVTVQRVPEETIRSVLLQCHKQSSPGREVRMTALLNRLIAGAVRDAIPARGDSMEHAFVGEIAMDMRRALNGALTADDMANCTSVEAEAFLAEDKGAETGEAMWEASGRTTGKLAERSSTLQDQPVGLLRYLSNYKQWTLSKMTTNSDVSFSLSNLGVFGVDAPTAGGWTIGEMAFSQSADMTGAPLGINVASVRGGAMTMTVTWRPGWLDVGDEDAVVHKICEGISNKMEAIARG